MAYLVAVALHESLGEGGERVDVAADAQGVHDEDVGSLGLAPDDDHDEGGGGGDYFELQVHFGLSIQEPGKLHHSMASTSTPLECLSHLDLSRHTH